MLTNIFFFLQTARPVLFDQQLVDQMIEDLEKVDLCSIGSHAMLSVSQDETDSELNTECKIHINNNNIFAYICSFRYFTTLDPGV